MKGYDAASADALEAACSIQPRTRGEMAELLQEIYNLGMKDGQLKQLSESLGIGKVKS